MTTARRIPCTSLARTLVDLAEVWPARRLSDAWDAALREHRTTLVQLQETAVPLVGRGHPSTDVVRDLLEQRDDSAPPADSELERVLYGLIECGGYGPLSHQIPLEGLCAIKGRVDGYLPSIGLVVEADGRRWHTRVLDFERDRERDTALQAHGIFVARFSYKRIMYERDAVFRILDTHFQRNGFVRSRSGEWVLRRPATA